MENNKILLVGCGKMGGALLKGIIQAGVLPRNIIVIEPHGVDMQDYFDVHDNFNIRVLKEFKQSEIDGFDPDLIILAVKPQVVAEILPHYKQFAEKSLFISIIAGKTISFFEKNLGHNAAVIRTMPNLPVVVGEGVIVWCKNKNVSDGQCSQLNQIFSSSGELKQITDEILMDAVTAISGSGPAYIFHFIECLTQAGTELGLPEKLASDLAVKTVRGSAALALASDKSAATLRQDVTSPGGTTEAALKILMQDSAGGMEPGKMQELIVEAAKAACKRSTTLSEPLK